MALKIKFAVFLFLIVTCHGTGPEPEPEPEAEAVPESTTILPETTFETGETAATGEPDTTLTTEPATEQPPAKDPCDPNPCPPGITCQARYDQNFTCLCLGGDRYDDKINQCVRAKVFPGTLSLTQIYEAQLNDSRSKLFKDTAENIVTELDTVYGELDGYKGSSVLEFMPRKTNKDWARSDLVDAVVDITFDPVSKVTLAEVEEVIVKASNCKDCVLKGSKLTEKKQCDKNPCDQATSECESKNGTLTCTCKDEYIKTPYSDRMCIACSSGKGKKGDTCEACPYGFSGLNCAEPWMLVTIILGVLGGLLLIGVIVLSVMTSKSPKKKKNPKKNKDEANEKPYASQPPPKSPMDNGHVPNASRPPSVYGGSAVSAPLYANAGVPKIPRATSNSTWDSRSNLEMTPSSSRQNLVTAGRTTRPYEDSDDNMYNRSYPQTRPQSSPYAQNRPETNLYGQSRPQTNPYAQNRPQTNPYAQSRPQTDPYAQSRPQSNPYAQNQGQNNYGYSDDDGRRFNY